MNRRLVLLTITNVLVATDFSDCSKAAVEYGRAVAQTFGARLHVMHVAEPPVTDFLTPGAPMPVVNTEPAERQLLETSINDDDRETLRAKLVFARGDGAAQSIAEYAAQRHIDLVVVGTHGRRGLARVLAGSVANEVIRIAPCPVLTVRAHAPSKEKP
jgi:nucleotide-binding universal stress UspA family protein